MAGRPTVADRLADALGTVLGTTELPLRLRGWDGSLTGPPGAPVLAVRSRRALRRLAWSPGQLGLGRAYVAGEIEIEDDVFDTFAALRSVGRLAEKGSVPAATVRDRLDLVGSALRLGAVGPAPAPPAEEADLGPRWAAGTPGAGTPPPSRTTTTSATTSTRSCSDRRWSTPARSGRPRTPASRRPRPPSWTSSAGSSGLGPGMRVLDVGCGWGSFAIHAAQPYGVERRGHHALRGAGGAGAQAGRPTPA